MSFLQLPPAKWREFFDEMSGVMRGRLVEVEVAGLDLGDQIVAEWLPLNGMAYEPKEDVLYVYTEPADGIDHAIPHPREVLVDLEPAGVTQVVVADADGRKQFVRLRAPLALPATSRADLVTEPERQPSTRPEIARTNHATWGRGDER